MTSANSASCFWKSACWIRLISDPPPAVTTISWTPPNAPRKRLNPLLPPVLLQLVSPHAFAASKWGVDGGRGLVIQREELVVISCMPDAHTQCLCIQPIRKRCLCEGGQRRCKTGTRKKRRR